MRCDVKSGVHPTSTHALHKTVNIPTESTLSTARLHIVFFGGGDCSGGWCDQYAKYKTLRTYISVFCIRNIITTTRIPFNLTVMLLRQKPNNSVKMATQKKQQPANRNGEAKWAKLAMY